MSKKAEPRAKGCPLCGKPSVAEVAPFCSRGCKSRDLLRWLGDGYRIAGPPVDEQDLAGVDRGDDDS